MLHLHRILVSAIALAASAAVLTACGQKGALYIPTDPGAAQRATLPQIINSTLPYGTPVPVPQAIIPDQPAAQAIPAVPPASAASAPIAPASTAK